MTEEGLRKEIFRYLSNETTISEMTIQDHVDRIMEIIQDHGAENGKRKITLNLDEETQKKLAAWLSNTQGLAMLRPGMYMDTAQFLMDHLYLIREQKR